MKIFQYKDVVGNGSTTRLLKSSIRRNSLHHFVKLLGVPGTGKTTCAEISALALTCESPEDGEPCLKCHQCKKNVRALTTTGVSNNIIKKNLGKLNTQKDINEVILEIFKLENPIGNNVYILEEFQALTTVQQMAFLEYLERLADNTYVFLCSSRPQSVIKEIKDRGITFTFNKLKPREMSVLYDLLFKKLAPDGSSNPYLKTLVLNKCDGVPRQLTNLLTFIIGTHPSIEDIEEYLGKLRTEYISDFFLVLNGDLGQGLREFEFLVEKFDNSTIFRNIKNYMIDALFYIEAGINENLTEKDCKIIRDIFSYETLRKLCMMLDKTPDIDSEGDMKYLIFKIYTILKKTDVKEVLIKDKANASEANVHATLSSNEIKSTSDAEDTGALSALDFFNRGGN